MVGMNDEKSNILANLKAKNDEELKIVLDELCKEEADLSFRRRVLHGKIDILRAELAERFRRRHEKGEPIINEYDIGKLSEILAKGGIPNSRRSRELINDS